MRQAPGLAALLLPALLLMTGCRGHRAPDTPEDSALAQATASGRQSLEFGRPKQAIDQYQKAYTLALARDDAQTIGDVGFNLAVAQLADDDVAGSLRTARRTRDALAARATAAPAELDLVQAAALHRLGRDREADWLAAQAQATASNPATVARASYVRGLIADKRGDTAGLEAALAWFDRLRAPHPSWEADRDELAARLDLRQGQYGKAAASARRAADAYRSQLDYHAMAEALALAAKATQRAGSPQDAANLYLRAGESAAARGDAASAKSWLAQATGPGVSPSTRHAAQGMLATLRETPSD
ncbi:MAG: hypothetical protein JOY63_03810 [Acetobacteraceae bacterium]|nr:hypothetical protein [Acetobacteraceae bacterium]